MWQSMENDKPLEMVIECPTLIAITTIIVQVCYVGDRPGYVLDGWRVPCQEEDAVLSWRDAGYNEKDVLRV
jgi:hypothetical protein